MKNTPDNKPETDPVTEKFDELRDAILDRIAAGEEPRSVAESLNLPHVKLSEWLMRQDNYKALFSVHRANLIHKQMVIEQVQPGAIATLAQIACNTEDAGSFDSTAESRRMETVRKSCVDILRFNMHAFEPPKRRQTNSAGTRHGRRDDDGASGFGSSGGGNSGGPENPLDSFKIIADPNPADCPPSGESVLFALDWLNKPLDSEDREEFDKFIDDYSEEWGRDQRSADPTGLLKSRSSILTSRPLFFKRRYSHTSLKHAASDRRVVEERSPPLVV